MLSRSASWFFLVIFIVRLFMSTVYDFLQNEVAHRFAALRLGCVVPRPETLQGHCGSRRKCLIAVEIFSSHYISTLVATRYLFVVRQMIIIALINKGSCFRGISQSRMLQTYIALRVWLFRRPTDGSHVHKSLSECYVPFASRRSLFVNRVQAAN